MVQNTNKYFYHYSPLKLIIAKKENEKLKYLQHLIYRTKYTLATFSKKESYSTSDYNKIEKNKQEK
jgi:hypothetical protein